MPLSISTYSSSLYFQSILHDLNKNFDIIKLVTQSLVKCHKQAVTSVGDGQLDQNTLVDGRYPHVEVTVMAQLSSGLFSCIG